jgi:plasmid stabilization system protein ParE
VVKIVWTELAVNDLKEIFEYISEDSFRYANLTINRIYQTTQILSISPLIGKIVQELNDFFIKELLAGNYRIIYKIKSET